MKKNKLDTSNFEMIAKTYFGFESILANELKQLGAKNIKILNRAIKFVGDNGFLYKANYSLRTAIKILKPVKVFKIDDQEDFYKKILSTNWDLFMTIDDKFMINSNSNSNIFKNSLFLTQKFKDGIVDFYKKKYGMRPDINLIDPTIVFDVYLYENSCTISLDSSGESLHKRGYRLNTGLAPLSEVLAAGLILISGWDKKKPLFDGMCGSGTILIEAAMIALNIPPQINRKKFAFQNWIDFDESLWNLIVNSQKNKIKKSAIEITGYEINNKIFEIAKKNILNAGLNSIVKISNKNFFNSSSIIKKHIIINPPYGVRLKENSENFYKNIGDLIKNKFIGSDVWIISSNLESIKKIRLKPSKKFKLYQGKLECKFLNYKIYKGSKIN